MFSIGKFNSRHHAAAVRPRRKRTRTRRFERLESRTLLATAEGTPLAMSESSDTGGALVGRVDYSLDTNNFFDTQLKKDLFQQAVDTILSHLGDDLAAIMPSGQNTWTAEFLHPGTGASQSIKDLRVSADEIVIYAGGRELGTSLGVGGPGGFRASCIDASFCEVVATRGELGARTQAEDPPPTDFGPWGGSVSFDSTTDFYFSESTADLGTQQSDFLSVAMHEVAHLLGFGTSASWQTYASGDVFTGPASRAANGNQSVLLSSDGGHWAAGTTSEGQPAALGGSLTSGTRELLTTLDFAGLEDVGWETLQFVGDDPSWHNVDEPWDVDGDGHISPIDALRIINDLNRRGARQLAVPELAGAPLYLDVNNDGFASPLDALLVVNFLNEGTANSEGEARCCIWLTSEVRLTRLSIDRATNGLFREKPQNLLLANG